MGFVRCLAEGVAGIVPVVPQCGMPVAVYSSLPE